MPLSYQWTLNGTNILNATNNVLSIARVGQSDLGVYAVIITNSLGSATSSNAVLTMFPAIHQAFSGGSTTWGKSLTLSIEAWGTGPLSYQWFLNGAVLAGATNTSLSFDTVQFTNAGFYSVIVSSPLGQATNSPAQLIVNPSGVSLGLYPGVEISGEAGYSYVIQGSYDLSKSNAWTTLAQITLTQSVQLWVDTNSNTSLPSSQRRFYRVLPGL